MRPNTARHIANTDMRRDKKTAVFENKHIPVGLETARQ
jgi:hypothetical protein